MAYQRDFYNRNIKFLLRLPFLVVANVAATHCAHHHTRDHHIFCYYAHSGIIYILKHFNCAQCDKFDLNKKTPAICRGFIGYILKIKIMQ